MRVDILSASLSKFDDTCHNGDIGCATVTSGTPPINYLWNTTPPQTTATATGLYGDGVTGSIFYTVAITDGAGCRLVDSIAIKDGAPTDLYVVNSGNPTTCNGHQGFIKLDSLIAGQTFVVAYDSSGIPATRTLTADAAWSVTMAGLGKGLYNNIHIITPHCPYNVVGPVSLSDPPQPSLPAVGSNSPVCFGFPLNLTALSNPGVSYTSNRTSRVWNINAKSNHFGS